MGLLLAEFGAGDSPCGVSGVGAAAVATGVSGLAAGCAITDATGSAEGADAAVCSVGDAAAGCSTGAAVAAAAGSLAGVGAAVLVGLVEPVAPDEVGAFVGAFVTPADAVMSLLDGAEPVCGPPELCTIPERGSAVDAPPTGEVELVWASTELCTIPDAEPEDEPAAEADELVDGVEAVDDVLAAESDDEPEADDDEPDDELDEPESDGSANAIPGVLATAAPAPSATANTPTRAMNFASPIAAPSADPHISRRWLKTIKLFLRPGDSAHRCGARVNVS